MPISKRNRRGLFILLAIGILISYTPRIVMAFENDPEMVISFEELEVIEEEIQEKKEYQKSSYSKRKKWTSKYKAPQKAFDPNEYSKEEWMSLGLSEKQVDVVLKFSKNGLKSNEDLKRIFVIPDALYKLIEDSTFYPERQFKQNDVVEEKIEVIDINVASNSELMSLPGIGEYYAKKIIEYRIQLGGFKYSNQLLEIWKFDQERLDKIEPRISLGSSIKKININEASIDDLKSHPYISYKVANSIVKMRMANGLYSKVDDILESKLIDRALFNRIKYYLKIES